jgi:hypothetical protein
VTPRRAIPLAVLATLLASGSARAYRPFDETDASVAETGAFELELGPLGFTHDEDGNSYTPGFIVNYGLVHRVELVADAHHALLFGGATPAARRRALDTALLGKVVLREGCLQGLTGPSVAFEGGAILPTVPAAGDPGLALTVIASQRWPALTVSVDLEGDRTRRGTAAFIGGTILEGPDAWTVRPVAEFVVAREESAPTVAAALAGAIWRRSDRLSFDLAGRAARQDATNAFELRAGLTWVLGP